MACALTTTVVVIITRRVPCVYALIAAVAADSCTNFTVWTTTSHTCNLRTILAVEVRQSSVTGVRDMYALFGAAASVCHIISHSKSDEAMADGYLSNSSFP
jgi:hypothetical protein